MTSTQNATMSLALAQAPGEPNAFVRWWQRSWHPVVFVIAVLFVWWLVTTLKWVKPFIIPSPGDTWAAFANNAAYLAQHTWVTTYETLVGFVIAVIVGLFVAVIMVYSRGLEQTLYPVILFAQVIPKIAIAPLFIVWLGFGMEPKILVAVLMAFFPVVISGLAGLRSVDPEILQMAGQIRGAFRETAVGDRRPGVAIGDLVGPCSGVAANQLADRFRPPAEVAGQSFHFGLAEPVPLRKKGLPAGLVSALRRQLGQLGGLSGKELAQQVPTAIGHEFETWLPHRRKDRQRGESRYQQGAAGRDHLGIPRGRSSRLPSRLPKSKTSTASERVAISAGKPSPRSRSSGTRGAGFGISRRTRISRARPPAGNSRIERPGCRGSRSAPATGCAAVPTSSRQGYRPGPSRRADSRPEV